MVLYQISALCEPGVKACWLFCKKIFRNQHLLLEFKSGHLALETGPDLKSDMWLHILSLPILAVLHKSFNLPETWFSHICNGNSSCSAYLWLIVKIKWNVSLPLGLWESRFFWRFPPDHCPSSLESCWSLSSFMTLKIQKSYGSTTER